MFWQICHAFILSFAKESRNENVMQSGFFTSYLYKKSVLLFIVLAPVVQKLDNAIHRINLYLLDNAIGFPSTYPLDTDLSAGWLYPSFEQPWPEVYFDLSSCLFRQKNCSVQETLWGPAPNSFINYIFYGKFFFFRSLAKKEQVGITKWTGRGQMLL